MARMVMNVTPKTPQPYGKGDLASAEPGRERRREPPPPIPPWRGGPSRSAAKDRGGGAGANAVAGSAGTPTRLGLAAESALPIRRRVGARPRPASVWSGVGGL